jgi:glutathionylspermidine synthase
MDQNSKKQLNEIRKEIETAIAELQELYVDLTTELIGEELDIYVDDIESICMNLIRAKNRIFPEL